MRMGKKQIIAAGLLIVLVVLLCACAKPIEEDIEIMYGESFTITNETLEKKTDLVWTSSDTNIVTVKNAVIEGNNPGEAVITATQKDKLVAQYTVTVTLIPVEEDIEIVYGESYTVSNESLSSKSGLVWTSSDEKVAKVSDAVITSGEPGESEVTVTHKDNVVAKYHVKVVTIPVTSIVLSTNTCEIVDGESYSLSYTLFPSNASDYGLDWRSANDSVATVDQNGTITAIAPGQTTISIANPEGFIATCSVTVKKALPNFKQMYSKWENETWFSVADDGAWMRFDTNPDNDDGDYYWRFYAAMNAVNEHLPEVLEELGYSSSVYQKMKTTTWSMGRQTASTDTTTATWTYHPDKGLEILIEVNN